MITREQAVRECERHFPEGLKRIVRSTGIAIINCEMTCDGWGFRTAKGEYKIRLNTKVTRERRNFTIAHEVAHLILHSNDISPIIPVPLHGYDFKSPVEREADTLASELLLPSTFVCESITDGVVRSDALRRIARRAKVSEIVAAIRLRNLGAELGLDLPYIYFLDEPSGLSQTKTTRQPVSSSYADKVYDILAARPSRTAKFKAGSNSVVATALSNPNHRTLFVHLAKENTQVVSEDERKLGELAAELLALDPQFYKSLSGMIASWADRHRDLELQECVDQFLEHYENESLWRNRGAYQHYETEICREFVYLKFKSRSS